MSQIQHLTNSSGNTIVQCPSCGTFLTIGRHLQTFRCPCGVELQQPHELPSETSNQPVEEFMRFIGDQYPSREGNVVTSNRSTASLEETLDIASGSNSNRVSYLCNCCSTKFSLLKRKRTCRNCQAKICHNCSTSRWPAIMLAKTKNSKGEKYLRICDHCNGASIRFRKCLLQGDLAGSQSVLNDNNVELYCPNYFHTDHYYPIHCAISSGNLELIQWLLTKRCNPRVKDSKGNSGLGIAASRGMFEIAKFLIFRGHSQIEEIKNISSLQRLLRTSFMHLQKQEISLSMQHYSPTLEDTKVVVPSTQLEADEHLRIALELSEKATIEPRTSTNINELGTEAKDECAICLENNRDCVFVPCGHVSCCLECGCNLSECPVCREKVTQVVKMFRT